MAQRTEGQEYPGERAEPRSGRHTGFLATRQGDEAAVRIPDPAGKDEQNLNSSFSYSWRRFPFAL